MNALYPKVKSKSMLSNDMKFSQMKCEVILVDTKKLMEKSRNIFRQATEPLGYKSDVDEKTANLSQEQGVGIDREISGKKVTIYALSTCPWCKKAKKFFVEKGLKVEYIEYDKVDKEMRKSIAEECAAYMKELAFPVVKSGEKVVVGYDIKKYENLLNE